MPSPDWLYPTEASRLKNLAGEAASEARTPDELASAASQLLEARRAYLARVGEHFGLEEWEGIELVDRLDEHLLRVTHQILSGAGKTGKHSSDAAIHPIFQKTLAEFWKATRTPVAFMVIAQLGRLQKESEVLLKSPPDGLSPREILALLVDSQIALVGEYLRTRDTPVQRHFSEVSREYAVLARLQCECQSVGFELERQQLVRGEEGVYEDVLDAVCRKCRARRTVRFPLRYFSDLSSIGGHGRTPI